MSKRQQLRISSEARVQLPDGRTVVTGGTRTIEVPVAAPTSDEPTHSQGFASIRWKGKLFWFIRQDQRLIVAHLWEACEAGDPCVDQHTLLDVADLPAGGKLRDVFRGSEAWGELIVPGPRVGGPVGTFALAWAARD